MRTIGLIFLSFFSALVLTARANAFVITDVYGSDANVITNAENLITIPETPPAFGIFENYGETFRVPYPSHSGFGIVNAQGNFFDKVVTPEAFDTGEWTLIFDVTNTTPWTWSDYHFEFWDPNFSSRLSNFPLVVSSTIIPVGPWQSDTFQNSAFDGSILSFWEPSSLGPGVTGRFNLTMDLDQIAAPFGIRQVATTIP
ncbi:MAG: hypothetical protein MI920_27655, partial [Kiloniellales bacterium]|nr:hypothetical protein [Kiloniellales bacterium]